ncbi:beta-N-acetylhexosaminidase, partial [Streptomyces sp. NPDC001919]
AARNGAGLILSPADRSYLDMKYTKDTKLGLAPQGLRTLPAGSPSRPGGGRRGAGGGAPLRPPCPLTRFFRTL